MLRRTNNIKILVLFKNFYKNHKEGNKGQNPPGKSETDEN